MQRPGSPEWGSYKPMDAMCQSVAVGMLNIQKEAGLFTGEPAVFLSRDFHRKPNGFDGHVNLVIPAKGSSEPAQTNLFITDNNGDMSIIRMLLKLDQRDSLIGVDRILYNKSISRFQPVMGDMQVHNIFYGYDLKNEGTEAAFTGIMTRQYLMVEQSDGVNRMEAVSTSGSDDVMTEKIVGAKIGINEYLEERGIVRNPDLLRTIDFWLRGFEDLDGNRILLADQRDPGAKLLLPAK